MGVGFSYCWSPERRRIGVVLDRIQELTAAIKKLVTRGRQLANEHQKLTREVAELNQELRAVRDDEKSKAPSPGNEIR